MWIASYPSMDHASRHALEEKLGRIETFYATHVAPLGLTVTVLLSIASQLRNSPYTMPEPGLWNIFVAKCCISTKPHRPFCKMIGDKGRSEVDDDLASLSSPDTIDEDFAKRCDLPFHHIGNIKL